MRKIIYETLKGQNFLSIGYDTVEIDFQKGMNLITGENLDNAERKNGIGKSCILELFYYSIFGTTVRKLKKERIINNVTKKGGFSEIVFRIETPTDITRYKVIRKLKPSSVELWKMGDVEENITRDSIANTDKYICELIGSNPTISKSCDIITSTDSVSFMSMKPEDKRKFHEDIFTLEVFGNMMKVLKEMVKETKQEFSTTSTKLDEINNTLDALNKQQEEYLKKVKDREAILEQKRKEIQNKIEEIENFISNIPVIDVVEIQKDKEKWEDAWNKLDGKIGIINNQISSKETLRNLKVKEIKQIENVI